jgi:hypothetical protein
MTGIITDQLRPPPDQLSLKISRLLTLNRPNDPPQTSAAIESLDALMNEINTFIDQVTNVDRECILVTPPLSASKSSFRERKLFLGAIQTLTPTSPESKKSFSFSNTFKSLFSTFPMHASRSSSMDSEKEEKIIKTLKYNKSVFF